MGLQKEEYTRLTNEIDMYAGQIAKTTTICFGLYIAIMGYGFNTKNGTTMAFALLPIVIGVIMLCQLYDAMDRTSSYVKEVYEGEKNGIFWETSLQLIRSNPKYKSQRTTMMKMILVMISCATIPISLYYFINFDSNSLNNSGARDITVDYIYFGLLLVDMLLLTVGLKSVSRRRKNYETLIQQWKNITNKHSQKTSQSNS